MVEMITGYGEVDPVASLAFRSPRYPNENPFEEKGRPVVTPMDIGWIHDGPAG